MERNRDSQREAFVKYILIREAGFTPASLII